MWEFRNKFRDNPKCILTFDRGCKFNVGGTKESLMENVFTTKIRRHFELKDIGHIFVQANRLLFLFNIDIWVSQNRNSESSN